VPSDPPALTIVVECYAGYRGEETPRQFHIGERAFAIERIVDAWLAPDHGYFKVRTSEGELCILRHDVASGGWELTMFQRPSGH